jgi:hypothetical protein
MWPRGAGAMTAALRLRIPASLIGHSTPTHRATWADVHACVTTPSLCQNGTYANTLASLLREQGKYKRWAARTATAQQSGPAEARCPAPRV